MDVLDGVFSLLDKSLLGREETSDEESRFVMLETIHEYATEKLKESGEYRELRASHARYFLALAEEAAPEIEGPNQVSWMDRLEAEHDNLRAALSWSLETGDAESALRIGGALWWFWVVRGQPSESRRWLAAGLSGGEAAPVGVRARALLALGDLALRQGDYTRAVEDLEASVALYREAGDRRGEAHPLSILGWIAAERNDLERAEVLLEESLALSRAAGTARDVRVVLNAVATLELYRGETERAATMLEEALSLAREAGDIRSIAIYTTNLALTAAVTGEYERAETFAGEAQKMHRELGEGFGDATANVLLGFLALSRNDPGRAEEFCVEAMRELHERAHMTGVNFSLDILAGVAAARGEIRRAARLWGAVAASREAMDIPWPPEEREMIKPHIDAARTRLDEATWREGWEEGRAMTPEDSIAYALENTEERA